VRVLGRLETTRQQLVGVTAVQAAGLVLFAGDMAFGLALVIAAAAVQLGLACRGAALTRERRYLCLDLIVEGDAALALPCFERTCRRLLDGRTLRSSRGRSTRWWRPRSARRRCPRLVRSRTCA
jgi:hypothetical protein